MVLDKGSDEANAQVAVLDRVVGQEGGVVCRVHDGALFDDVVPVGQLGADFQVLLDQQDGDARGLDGFELGHDLFDDHRSQALHGFVEHQQLGRVHERPANGQHLLLTTRKLAAAVAASFFQAREDAVDVIQLPGRVLALTQQQVFFDGE